MDHKNAKILDHINLTVKDVITASTFLKEHLGYSDVFEVDANMAVLTNGGQTHISLMKGSKTDYPKLFHIGFDYQTEAEVDQMHAYLTAVGIDVTKPARMSWGSYTFHFTCPGSEFVIEIAC